MRAALADAWRSLHGRRGAVAVVVVGLILALAACLLLALLTIALAQPAPFIRDPARVVVLDFKGNPPGQPSPWFTASPLSFGPMLKQRQVPLDLISRLGFDGLDIRIDGRIESAYLLMADPDLVPLLGLPALHGDLQATLLRHDGIAVTTELVRRLWGDLPPAQALGRRIESRGLFFTVGAVLPNTDPRSPFWEPNPIAGQAMAMVGFDSQGNASALDERDAIYLISGRVFARLRPGGTVEQIGPWMREAFVANPLYAQLPAAWRTGRDAAYFRGVSLAQLPFEGEANGLRWRLLGTAAAACALLLLLAACNAVNLHAASLLQRQRETALRRCLGADAARLLALWSVEVLLQLLMAAGGALLLAWMVAPSIATWMGLPPSYPVADPLPLPALAGLGVSVLVLLPAVVALPAWAALQRAPAPALQGRTASEGPWGRRVRQGLLTLQLGGALLLLSLAGVLALQQQHLLHADRGFDTRNRLWLGVMANPDALPDLAPLVDALDHAPAIAHWAFSSDRPGRDTQGLNQLYTVDTAEGPRRQQLRISTVSPGFFDTYGMTVLAGAPRTGTGETMVVIDAKAARLLGFANPAAAVGAVLRAGDGFLQNGSELRRVVAVVKDVTLESAREPPMPQAFVLSDKPQWDLTVYGPDLTALRLTLDALWQAHGPRVPHAIETVDAQRADTYRQEDRLTTLLAGIALLSVGVAMLGAYALVADTLRRRRTELVLRRLHGAGHGAVMAQVAQEFAWPLLVAAVVGWPLAAWLGEHYLAGFVERIDNGTGLVLPLAVAGAATVCITALAALRHLREALRLQPIEALR